MRPPKPHLIQRDWIAKTSAGLLLGFTLGLGCSGLFAHLCADMPLSIRSQLAMWMVAPVWLCTLSATYLFASGLRAWLWLGCANLLLFGLLGLARLS
ncbi:MAG: hypothetical protein H6R04_505 [Burkholderiaceae bacterium]|nr:hypothetical protein [Burkholderiaceae bacterium]